jgi:hypothetical protein
MIRSTVRMEATMGLCQGKIALWRVRTEITRKLPYYKFVIDYKFAIH